MFVELVALNLLMRIIFEILKAIFEQRGQEKQ